MARSFLSMIGLGLLVGCQPSSPAGASSEGDTLPGLPAVSSAPCEAAQKSLPVLSLPYSAEAAALTGEPFPPAVQSWLREKLLSSPIYTPRGRVDEVTYHLWLIEATHPVGSFTYAVLTDSTCRFYDTLCIAGLSADLNRLFTQSATLYPDGTIKIRMEERLTDLSGKAPQTTTRSYEKLYRVDSQQRRFMPVQPDS